MIFIPFSENKPWYSVCFGENCGVADTKAKAQTAPDYSNDNENDDTLHDENHDNDNDDEIMMLRLRGRTKNNDDDDSDDKMVMKTLVMTI